MILIHRTFGSMAARVLTMAATLLQAMTQQAKAFPSPAITKAANVSKVFKAVTAAVASVATAAAVASSPPDPTEIVNRAETLLWGKTLEGDFEMTITTPAWTRKLSLKVLMDRPEKSFVRVVAPAKDAGIRSLRIGTQMWNYIPAIERIVKIPPSMMLQPWLGSDFTNDDLTRESSIVDDYTHKLLGEVSLDGARGYQIEALPKPQAPVVWGKIHYFVRADFMPVRQEYFDERGTLIRKLSYSDERRMGDRTIPTRWEMQPADEPGKRTTITVRNARYDGTIDTNVFSLRNLDRKE